MGRAIILVMDSFGIGSTNDADLLVITAGHGCDPTRDGSEHTHEHIPVIAFGAQLKPGSIGKRSSFADIGQSPAEYFDLPPMEYGESFL